jgi:hypothetical protein
LLGFTLLLPLTLFGQTTVENGINPHGKAKTLLLKEDLRFGADEEEEEYLWTMSSVKIVPDKRGHMFIPDQKEGRILEFDPSGKYVATVVRQGNGPGELQGIIALDLLADGRWIALDGPAMGMPKIKYFKPDFTYMDETLPAGFGLVPFNTDFSPDGALISAAYANFDASSGKLYIKNGILSKDLAVVKEIYSAEQKLPNMGNLADNDWSKLIAERLKLFYKGIGYAVFDEQGNVYTALGSRYEITKWTPDMTTTQLVITREDKPIRNTPEHLRGYVDFLVESMSLAPAFQSMITKQTMDRALELSDPPITKQPIFGLIPMEDGKLLVIHDFDMGTRMGKGDIFDTSGKFIGQITVPDYGLMSHDLGQFRPRMVFRNGFAYTIVTDELGDNRAVRYTYSMVDADSLDN